MAALLEKREAKRREVDRVLDVEERELEAWLEEKRARMAERWRLATEVWKMGRVDVGAIRLPYPITPVEWPVEEMEGEAGEVVVEDDDDDDDDA